MSDKKKALLIGNYNKHRSKSSLKAIYHPLENIEKELIEIPGNEFEITITDDTRLLKYKSLSRYDLLISYADYWESKLKKDEVAGIISFVSGGGGLLVVHSGISYQSNFEFALLIGAKFTGHPDKRVLEFQTTAIEHPVMSGINGFSFEEEPYRFEMDLFSEKTVLFEYEFDGIKYPAGWALEFGKGRAVYLMPGHTAEPFLNENFRKVIINSTRWLTNN